MELMIVFITSNASRKFVCSTRLRGQSIETSRDFKEHQVEYSFDERVTSRGFYKLDSYDEDLDFQECYTFSSEYCTNSCDSLSSPLQTVNGDSDLSVDFRETARFSNAPNGDTEDTFEAWMRSMNKQAYAQQKALKK